MQISLGGKSDLRRKTITLNNSQKMAFRSMEGLATKSIAIAIIKSQIAD